MPTAFIDESRKEYAGRSVYIFGAVIFADDTALEAARRAMRLILLDGESKVHWYSAVDEYRHEIMSVVAGIDAMFLTVWHEMLAGDTEERSRRIALSQLVYELQLMGVDRAVLESRQPKLDRRDLDIFRSGPLAFGATRVRADHVLGRDDPALWAADALCGAEGSRLAANDRSHVELLGDRYDSISTRLRETD